MAAAMVSRSRADTPQAQNVSDKPILGLTDPAGDTAGVLRQAGLNDLARLDSVAEIASVLPVLVNQWRNGNAVLAQKEAVRQASRLGRSQALAYLLDQV